MPDLKAINSFIEKKLSMLKRDGVSVVEAASWLKEGKLLPRSTPVAKHLRELLRAGKISGAYQFPNKRWVIVNRSMLPDGIKRVLPLKEAADTLGISEASVRHHVKDGNLRPLNFGSSVLLFLEEEVRRFKRTTTDRSYGLLFPDDGKVKQVDIDKLRRQLYYLRSDIRLIAERIEELIRLLG